MGGAITLGTGCDDFNLYRLIYNVDILGSYRSLVSIQNKTSKSDICARCERYVESARLYVFEFGAAIFSRTLGLFAHAAKIVLVVARFARDACVCARANVT